MRKKIKIWVVKKASVTKPYNKKWSVSVTLGGYEHQEYCDTIEEGYNKLTDFIFNSKYWLGSFIKTIMLKPPK